MNNNLKIRFLLPILIFFIFGVVNTSAQTHVGAGQTYTTLESAFNAINNGTLTGDINLIITSDLSEIGTAVLYANGTGGSNYTSVTINPDGTTERIISGNIAGPLVDFNGADNVTMDGRYSGGGMYLRFGNLNTVNPTIRFINDASFNSINFTYIEGINTSTSSGVVIISNSTGTTGNDNITINNCHLINGSGGNPYNAIYVDGTLGAENDNLSFTNSRIYGFTNYGINFRATSFLGGGYTISNNHFYCPFVSGQDQYSIFSVNTNNTGHSFTISGNYIGGNSENASGMWTKSGGHFYGIYLNAGTGGIASSIQGNRIKNVQWSSGWGDFFGIYTTGANADYNIGSTSGNSIDSISNTATSLICRMHGIYCDADMTGGTVQIKNNTISNLTNHSSNDAAGVRAIYQKATNSIYSIENNSIHDITCNTTYGLAGLVGILMNTSSPGGTNVSLNSIYNLFQENTGSDTLDVVGIQSSGSFEAPFTVSRNKIFNLHLANSHPISAIYGIRVGGGFGDYSNNMISLGSGEDGDYSIYGIYKPTGQSRYYYNTIYIGGTVVSGSNSSAAFIRTETSINELKDNIFYNARTGGTGKHYAIVLNNNTTLTSDYNELFSSDPNNIGSNDSGITQHTFASWKSSTGLDNNSMSVPATFADAANGDLHVAGGSIGDNNLSGIPLVAVPADYDGETRNASYPYMGADEVTSAVLTKWKITSSVVGSGTITPSGETFIARGGSQSYVIIASTHYHIDSVVVNGVNQGAISNYSFSYVTSNNTITAYFSIDKYTITTSVNGNGSITPSGSVPVPYGGTQSFMFTPTFGYHLDSVLVDGSRVDSTTGYTFTNVTTNHSINLYFSINKYIITASVNGNGTITPSGSVIVTHGASQNFSIVPNTGYHFDSLMVDGLHVDSTTSYTFNNVTGNHAITSYFSANIYTITATTDANGSISPSGIVPATFGSSQKFTLIPNFDYHVDSVFVDGAFVDSSDSYTFNNISENHTIEGRFAINKYKIIAAKIGNGSITPEDTVIINHGGSQQFTIAPALGYHVDSLLVDGVRVDSTLSYTFDNVTSDHFIVANFSIDLFTITATSGSGGTISPAGDVAVPYGSNQQFIISSDVGYYIDSLFVNGNHVDSLTSYTFINVTASHTIHAKFTINSYNIVASAGLNGSISPVGTVSVTHGSSQQFVVTPDEGYQVDSVWVDGGFVDSTTSYTFNNVTSNRTIHVTFKIRTYTITATASAGGSITPNGTISVNHGEDKSFSFEPNTGYHFDSLLVNSVRADSSVSYTFYNISSNQNIAAYFSINQFTITPTSGTGGSITPSGIVSVNYGSSRQFTITPDAGYHLDSIIVDGFKVDSTISYTFTSVTSNHTINAMFSINVYTITASVDGNGSITPVGAVNINYGGSQLFVITPDLNYRIDSIIVDGNRVDSLTSYTFTNVSANHSIIAYFSINKYTIIASVIGGGSINPFGSIVLDSGADQDFTISPNTGYHVDSIVVDGIRVDSTLSYTFTNVITNHSIIAFFSIDKFTITASAGLNGTITPAGDVVVNYGSDQGFIITANSGYHVDSIVVDGGTVDSTTSYTFTNVSSDHTIAAYFSINIYTIMANSGLHGAITPDGDIAVIHGSEQKFKFVAEDGYHVDSVFVDDVFVDSTSGYTFYNVSANHTIFVKFALTLNPVPTLTAIIPSFGYRGETISMLLVGSDFIPNQTTVNVGVGINTDSLKYNGTDTIVAYVSIEPNTVLGDRNISVTNPAPGGGTSTDLIFSIINHKPTAVSLIAPTNNSTVYVPFGGPIEFMWNSSIDLDVEDSILYSINIKGPGIDTTLTGISDTAASMDIESLLQMHQYYRWTVSATDGYDVVASPDTFSFFTDFGEGVKDLGLGIPREYAMAQNYPNPFNPTTAINYQLPIESWVTVKVYNILGEEIATLVDELQVAGFKSVTWNAQQLPSGIYFVRMQAGTYSNVKKIVLAK